MQMSKRKILILAAVVIGLVIVSFFIGRRAAAPNEQKSTSTSASSEQLSEQVDIDNSFQPDINNLEFKLTSASIACSNSDVNGVTTRSCSGNIRIIPRAQSDREPGLYKINEQTKLLHHGQEQDLNSLQELSQNDVTVRLKLANGSTDTIAEISY